MSGPPKYFHVLILLHIPSRGVFVVIKAIFFDFYNTLGKFEPSREELQIMICKQFDIYLDVAGIKKGYGLADSYFAREISKMPLRQMNAVQSKRFFGEYQRIILKGAGVEVDTKLAFAIMEKLRETPKAFVLFDDVLPVLNALKGDNFLLGLLTNNEGNINKLCEELGLSNLMDVAINAEEVGRGKPYPDIFIEAMRRVNVEPYQTIYFGDQYDTDIRGALNAGIIPVLFDRDCVNKNFLDCARIENMRDIFDVLNNLS